MNIAIDYDNTYTLDPNFWNMFIETTKKSGHKVYCVTNRNTSAELAEPVLQSIGKYCPVIFAGDDWKSNAVRQQGIQIDIWIDDMPELISKQHILG